MNIKKYIILLGSLFFSFNSFSLSKMDTQEYYEQMTPYALCAAIAKYNNDNLLHNKLTNHMYDSLETYTKGEFLSNTKRGFMVGYVSGMSQAVFGQIYKYQGEPQGLSQKEFASMAQKKMCKKFQ
ncbi:hypothetical protein L3V31_00135 [Vibrio sp. J1-1]|uniref:hypothetical protein n=1 Tax=Vibrio sp. J1-1 TaxID=2912251 RepID=UPI001F1FC332|nr:hypothetical protein [Vibrio sp. J1-1]MCF7480145.1 hypothetical protein [Vibrio sp. J1-1]